MKYNFLKIENKDVINIDTLNQSTKIIGIY